MGIYRGLEQVPSPFRNAAVTIGNFDGVHVGHKFLFDTLKHTADRLGGESVVITFDPHPLHVIRPELAPEMIDSIDQRLELIRACGVDQIVVIPFTQTFSHVSARDFVREWLWDRIGMRAIVIGPDYAFGYRREGNLDLLRAMSGELGFEVVELQSFELDGERSSSTTIRDLIRQGNVVKARKFLGRPFQMHGEVVPGRRQGGSVLGYPTANLDAGDQITPAEGVYVVQVLESGRLHAGVCNVGHNPTFGMDRLSVEAYIFEFNENIYGREIRINFLERIRDEKKFSGPEELARQIGRDVEQGKAYFRSHGDSGQPRPQVA